MSSNKDWQEEKLKVENIKPFQNLQHYKETEESSEKFQNISMPQIEEITQQFVQIQKQIQSDEQCLQKSCTDSFQHLSAIEIMIKLIQRNYSRFFIRGLTYAYIQSLKNQRRPIEYQKNENYCYDYGVKKQINWPYKQLYILEYKTPQQEQLFQFVNLCATMIQSNFKRFITQKRHRIAINKTKKLSFSISALLKGWKTYRVYNSKKCSDIRHQVKQIQKQIDHEEEKIIGRDSKKLKSLYKYIDVHTKLFNETFNIYMNTGAWVFDASIKSKITRRYSKSKVKIISNIIVPPSVRINSESIQNQKYGSNNSEKHKENINTSNSFGHNNESISPAWMTANNNIDPQKINEFEQRPICAKGAYVINDNQIQKASITETRDQYQNQNYDENDNEQITKKNEEKQVNKKKMQKRQKYDPRKAIEEQKKKKQQKKQKDIQQTEKSPKLSQKQQKQEPKKDESILKRLKTDQSVGKSQQIKTKKVKQQKKKITIANKSSINSNQNSKKTKSKIDCWPSKQEEPEWIKQYKSRMAQEKTIQIDSPKKQVEKLDKKFNEFQNKPQRQEEPKFEYSWQRKQIQELTNQHQDIMRKNSSQNLREQLKSIQQRTKASKRNHHRAIIQLEETYNTAYSQRYQRLLPKLQLLAYARDVEKRSKIPVIDEESEILLEQLQFVEKSSAQFWSLYGSHQKVFRGFLTQKI